MTEYKLQQYGFAWDEFLGTSAWEFHVIVWDWYDQWRELDLQRIYYRNLRKCEPEQNGYDLIAIARLYEDQQLEAEIQARLSATKYEPINASYGRMEHEKVSVVALEARRTCNEKPQLCEQTIKQEAE